MTPIGYLVVFVATVAAGAVNAVAGGGTVISFPALVWAGLPLVPANATNATALVPGSVGGVVAFRRELRAHWRTFVVLLIPTVLGSLLGAKVVASTPEDIFRRVVPFLILFATIVFAARNIFVRMTTRTVSPVARSEQITAGGFVLGCVLQFIISFYGGYFGAGIGILMLTSLSVIGMHDVINMNAVKNALAICINGTASIFFMLDGKVVWDAALVGAVGSIIGGYILASYARRIDQRTLRFAIVAAGIVASGYLFYRLVVG
jgi:uncharacterized membrane protein YfcA